MNNKSLLENLRKKYSGVPPVFSIEGTYQSDGNSMDSWFYVGTCHADGHEFGFLYHLMVLNPSAGQGVKNPAFGSDMSVLNSVFSITDKTTGWYDSINTVSPLAGSLSNAEARILNIIAPSGMVRGDLNLTHVKAKMDSAEMDIQVRPYGNAIINSGSGQFPTFGNKENYQYSVPKAELTGKLIIQGKEYEIEGGNCWIDRQWCPTPETVIGTASSGGEGDSFEQNMFTTNCWAWMGISLDNDVSISLWEFVNDDDSRNTFATIMNADGTQAVVQAVSFVDDAEDVWVSPVTAQHYPTNWHLKIPMLNAELSVTCIPKGQEITSDMAFFNKYEAMSCVFGTYNGEAVNGTCIVELCGNWQNI